MVDCFFYGRQTYFLSVLVKMFWFGGGDASVFIGKCAVIVLSVKPEICVVV